LNTIAVSDAAKLFVCVRVTDPLLLPDNVTGACVSCGAAVQFRPSTPADTLKLCNVCAAPAMAAAFGKGDLHLTLTKEGLEEATKIIGDVTKAE
jgi:hypothetical protein